MYEESFNHSENQNEQERIREKDQAFEVWINASFDSIKWVLIRILRRVVQCLWKHFFWGGAVLEVTTHNY